MRGRCCAPEDIHDASRVAHTLGIPHFAFDRRELFEQEVVRPFVESYLAGQTPSPCVRCNRGVKMRELLAVADRLGARWVATGHYARVRQGAAGPELLRGCDVQKDQSYFLHMLRPDELERLLFPLGEATKGEVRAEALELDLPGATKGESQELCFVPSGRYDAFVDARADGRRRPGPILGPDGAEVGRHGGVHRFTVGQRKNLGVALGERVYVTRVDAESGAVHLGREEALLCREARLDECVLAPDQRLPLRCQVAVRYRGQPHPAVVEIGENSAVHVRFDEPVRAVVSGQVAVFYEGERVLGGGLIQSGC